MTGIVLIIFVPTRPHLTRLKVTDAHAPTDRHSAVRHSPHGYGEEKAQPCGREQEGH